MQVKNKNFNMNLLAYLQVNFTIFSKKRQMQFWHSVSKTACFFLLNMYTCYVLGSDSIILL